MKKWIWLALVVLVAVVVMGIGVFFHPREEAPVIASTRVETSQKPSKQMTNSHQVSADFVICSHSKVEF